MIIKHVKQKDDYTCGMACLAMVSEKTIHEVERIIGYRKGMSTEEMEQAIRSVGLLPNRQVYSTLFSDRVYIVSVPSLNAAGSSHFIVVCIDPEGRPIIFDPQKGREKQKFYTEKTLVSWFEPIEILNRKD